MPVFAVPVGADWPPADREVFGAAIGDARLQASLVDVSALVIAHGESPRAIDVRLSENGRPADLRRVTPAADGSPQRVSFRVAPARDTTTLYSVAVGEGETELTLANNQQSVLAPPAGTPRRVLLVEGAPGHEHSFLKRSIEEDPGLVVDVVVRKGENDRGESTFYVQAAADRAAALSDGVPASRRGALRLRRGACWPTSMPTLSPRDGLARIADFVAVRGGGLVVLGARSFDAGALAGTPLEPVLPVDLLDRAGGLARVVRSSREPFASG